MRLRKRAGKIETPAEPVEKPKKKREKKPELPKYIAFQTTRHGNISQELDIRLNEKAKDGYKLVEILNFGDHICAIMERF